MKTTLILAAFILGVSCFPEKRFINGCNHICPMYVMTFCGSDGQTYTSNECVLKSQWCREGRNDYDSFHTLHFGACTGDELTNQTAESTTTTA